MRLLLSCAIVAMAGATTHQARQNPPVPPSLTTLSGGTMSLYRSIRLNLLEAAETMPEANYPFKPTPDVRTFGELIGHVSNTHYTFCAAGRAVPNPNQKNLETLTAKSDLVKALKESVAFCDAAYDKLTDAEMMAPAKWGETQITKGYVLSFNIAHDNEHYGNIATYMRLKGLVPPSTERSGRGGGHPLP